MSWPTTWYSLRAYRLKATCGCRYNLTGAAGEIVAVSPNRMQRCFRHMKSSGAEVRADVRRGLGLDA